MQLDRSLSIKLEEGDRLVVTTSQGVEIRIEEFPIDTSGEPHVAINASTSYGAKLHAWAESHHDQYHKVMYGKTEHGETLPDIPHLTSRKQA